MTTPIILASIFTIFVITAINGQLVNNCDVSQKEAEHNLNKLIFYGDRKANFPSSNSDVTKYCQMVQSHLKNLNNFVECLRGLPKYLFGLVATGFKKHTTARCASPNWRKKFIDFGNCVKGNHLQAELHKCIDRATLMNEFISQNVNTNHKVSMACCVTQLMSNCFHVKSKVCGNELSTFPFVMVNQPIAGVFNLMCSSTNSLKKCIVKHPTYMKKIQDLLKSGAKPEGSYFNSQLLVTSRLHI